MIRLSIGLPTIDYSRLAVVDIHHRSGYASGDLGRQVNGNVSDILLLNRMVSEMLLIKCSLRLVSFG